MVLTLGAVWTANVLIVQKSSTLIINTIELAHLLSISIFLFSTLSHLLRNFIFLSISTFYVYQVLPLTFSVYFSQLSKDLITSGTIYTPNTNLQLQHVNPDLLTLMDQSWQLEPFFLFYLKRPNDVRQKSRF